MLSGHYVESIFWLIYKQKNLSLQLEKEDPFYMGK